MPLAGGVCPVCHKTQLRGKYRSVYGACAGCCKEDVRAQGRAEVLVKAQLELAGLEGLVHNQTDPRTRSRVARVRADFHLVREGCEYDVVIEVDEAQHRDRPPAQELQRMLNMVHASGGRPHLIFRLNPDQYKTVAGQHGRGVTGKEYVDALRERVAFMLERIDKRERNVARRQRAGRAFAMPVLYVEYLFFDTDTENPRYQAVSVRQYQAVKDAEKRVAALRA